jgi:peptidoglycan/xylan/chitin deacetylase (PgdA/CDA1 family)
MRRRTFLQAGAAVGLHAAGIPEKLVVLTFDDAVKSHRTFVAPLLKQLGFGATFFVTHRWMEDAEHFMTWREIGEIHAMGFEIGNHSWTHADFSTPRNVARLAGELALVENELKKAGVPKPTSFAWCGNTFGPEALQVVKDNGFRLARRGGAPEVEYGTLQVGPLFDPRRHDPLLIPTTADAYPKWTPEHFARVLSQGRPGQAIVLQFHGVPDVAHPWVHTEPENFKIYMAYLKDHGFRAIALRDLAPYIDFDKRPADPMVRTRYKPREPGKLPLPVEVEASRAGRAYWLENMGAHRYTPAETALVLGEEAPTPKAEAPMRVRPYPGGRPLRIGFREGAINPLRGTKASVFLPWAPEEYAVVDLPEAIFSDLGLLFLAHTHIPTIWNERNVNIDNVDWERLPSGGLKSSWRLPNGVSFGASVEPGRDDVRMELWLNNVTERPLSKLRTQICVLLKGAPSFAAQTADNKVLGKTAAAVRASSGGRWMLTEWKRCGRVWGNPQCPCMHSDPVLPDCAPGETVRVAGRLWFAEGDRSPLG